MHRGLDFPASPAVSIMADPSTDNGMSIDWDLAAAQGGTVDTAASTGPASLSVDGLGRKLGQGTIGTSTRDHLGLVRWAAKFGEDRQWAVEDCRHLSRRLERDLFGGGERIVRVALKLRPTCGTRPGLMAIPTPSTHWRWPGLRCVSRTCPSPGSTDPTATSGSWWITARTSSLNAPASSRGCAGTCTRPHLRARGPGPGAHQCLRHHPGPPDRNSRDGGSPGPQAGRTLRTMTDEINELEHEISTWWSNSSRPFWPWSASAP